MICYAYEIMGSFWAYDIRSEGENLRDVLAKDVGILEAWHILCHWLKQIISRKTVFKLPA